MKIGIIISAFTNGGAQRVAVTLSRWLNDNEHEGYIIALSESKKNQYDAEGINLVRLETLYKGQTLTQRLRSFDQSNQIDAYVVMGVPMCIYVMPALKGSKAKIIVSERNDPHNFQGKTITKLVSRYLMSKADGFVFQTNDALDYYKKYKNKSVVIPNPVVDVPVVLERLPNEQRDKVIVTAGRLVPQKNHEMLIKAFGKIADRFPEYKLIIYGEGELKEKLQLLTKELGISNRVVFPGSVNDLHERIKNAELFVLSSDFEGMPNALMEAMAMGITCISTNCPCGGPKDLIYNGHNGYLIPVNDIDKCVDIITSVLDDKKDADRIGQNSLKTRDKYCSDVICSEWLNMVTKVVNA